MNENPNRPKKGKDLLLRINKEDVKDWFEHFEAIQFAIATHPERDINMQNASSAIHSLLKGMTANS